MNDLIEFLTSQEIIVVYILIGIACFLYFVIVLFDKNYYKRKRKQNTKELNKIIEDINQLDSNSIGNQTEKLPQEPVILEQISTEEPVVVKPPEVVAMNEVAMKEEAITSPSIIEEKLEVTKEAENLVLDNMLGVKEEVLVVEERQEKDSKELEYTDIEPNPVEAQAELQKLTEALEKAEEETKSIELTSFEEEQEQNAIISLDELLTKGKAMYENNEFDLLEDEGDEPISLQDLELRMNKKKETTQEIVPEVIEEPVIIEPIQEKMILDEFNNIKIEEAKPMYQVERKFQSSPVISPVYGIEKEQTSSITDIALENTANYDKLDDEIRKTNEFLMTLKELQKNLD